MRCFVFLVVSLFFLYGCESFFSVGRSSTWHFVPTDGAFELKTSPIAVSGDPSGRSGLMIIKILCGYGSVSVAEDCMTEFVFMRFEPIASLARVDFTRDGFPGSMVIDLHRTSGGALTVSSLSLIHI